MTKFARPLQLAGKLALALVLVGISSAAIDGQDPKPSPNEVRGAQATRALALESLHGFLEQIGWPKDMRERLAPRFLGQLKSTVPNTHGGNTVTYDGSRPGLISTVKLVLDGAGQLVGEPMIEIADTSEAHPSGGRHHEPAARRALTGQIRKQRGMRVRSAKEGK